MTNEHKGRLNSFKNNGRDLDVINTSLQLRDLTILLVVGARLRADKGGEADLIYLTK